MDLAFAAATEQARLVRESEVSSRELVELYLRRIDARNGDLNAYVHVFADQARELAAVKDDATAGGDELPPFHGVPIAIKELNFLDGFPATLATKSMAQFVAPFDDEVIARLKRAGVVPLGKTNAPELGTVPYTEPELFGASRNPWNLAHTPGGSSGGAAAALAAGLCPAAQGSDGGGSIRIPSSNCGLFGLKPTRDRVSNGPLFGDHAFGLVTNGVLTRTVADAAAFLDVVAGHSPGDPGLLPPPERPFQEEMKADPGRLRVGVATANPFREPAAEVLAAVDDARTLLEELGHDTFDVDVAVPEEVVAAFERLWWALIASQPLPPDTLEPLNRWMVEQGRGTSAADYLAAQFQLQLYTRTMAGRFHHEFDVLLTPVLSELPLRVGELDGLEPPAAWERIRAYACYTPIQNASGQPAASVPLHWDRATGLPVGIQLVGRFADEVTLLRLSARLEEARPWADRRPPAGDEPPDPDL
ncbi:MAG: amidase [Nitriliruptorales bacterium]